MPKPVVFFRDTPYFENGTHINKEKNVVPFERAHIQALDHPKLGSIYVVTSQIVEKYNDGSFETLNTIYLPA